MQLIKKPKSVPTFHFRLRQTALGGVLVMFSVLSGCGGSSNSPSPSESAPPPHQHKESQGRLALYDADASAVKIFSLEEKAVLGEFPFMAAAAPALYASPDSRYALVVQRTENRVHFIDGGLYSEDHGDHMHDYTEAPLLSSFELDLPRPTHYSPAEDFGVIFNDGNTGIVSTVTLISDESIGAGSLLPEVVLDNNQHGVAKLVGDQLFVTYRDASIIDTTLPAQVDRYQLDGDSLTFVERYEDTCPLLHGAANNDDYLIFGCGDGALVIDLNAPAYPASKLANPEFLVEGSRIGTVVAHPEVVALVGIAGNQLMRIDPGAEVVYTALPLPDSAKRLTQGFDAHGESFYVLTDAGNLHLFAPEIDWGLIATVSVTAPLAEGAPAPAIVTSKTEDRLYVLDPSAKAVVVVDSLTGEIISTIALDFTATRIAWLGFVGGGDSHNH